MNISLWGFFYELLFVFQLYKIKVTFILYNKMIWRLMLILYKFAMY